MRGQAGSILVGVIALSLVMTVAAAGFLYLAANTDRDELDTLRSTQRFNAAETGLVMGMAWLRAKSQVYIETDAPDSVPISGGYQAMDGWQVEVVLRKTPGVRTLKSRATEGSGKDTLEITWRVDAVEAVVPPFSILRMRDRQETLKPGTD